MSTINQNNAMLALDIALVPSPYLIDSRSDIDQYSTLVGISSLLNFYDKNNTVNGDWLPFLLKDPIFLLSSIAKTPFNKMHSLYFKACTQLKQLIQQDVPVKRLSHSFNALFQEITNVFEIIERWTFYMQQSEYTYTLRTFLTNEVQNTYSALLWAVLALQEQLTVYYKKLRIAPVNTYIFESYDQKIWKDSKGKTPFWKVLGLDTGKNCDPTNYNFKCNTLTDFFVALKNAGKKVFSFFNKVITYASTELTSVKQQKVVYPDTMLLRTFVDLFDVYKQELNTLSNKHLDFYFRSILKQKELPITADTTYICATLANNDNTFALAAGTHFLAGTDANSNPILFENDKKVVLNPAVIQNAYTLTKNIDQATLYQVLYLNTISDVNTVKTDESGQIEKWETFGTSIQPTGVNVQMGFAFASPMLYLQLATTRKVTITFTFKDDTFKVNTFGGASYFLSTENDWFLVKNTSCTATANTFALTLTLDANAPAITNFKKNPDGYTSSWPIFKVVFSQFIDVATPPQITSIDIAVDVTESQNFQLYSDFGMLSTKKPFQPFGPTPNNGQHFNIGNSEIFSKPVDNLTMTIDWSNLPDDFSVYYQQYNAYLQNQYGISDTSGNTTPDLDALSAKIDTVAKDDETKSKLETLLQNLKTFFTGKDDDSQKNIIPATPPYNSDDAVFYNSCFKVDFQLLQNGLWKPFSTERVNPIIIEDDNEQPSTNPVSLFYLDPATEPSSPSSIFFSTNVNKDQGVINPTLQNQPLAFSETTMNGFLRMQLTDPSYGFGGTLYPNVVAAIAIYNAKLIAEIIQNDSQTLIEPPNIPYTPTVKLFKGSYTASTTYTFDDTTTDAYPYFEYYYYTPFQTYQAYNNENGIATNGITLASPIYNPSKTTLPLVPSFSAEGTLFIALETVIAPSELSLYIELARSYNNVNTDDDAITYNYLSTDGWKTLPLLADETHNFSCSGIIKFNLPSDITKSSQTMPSNVFWISISVTDAPDHYAQTVFLDTNGIQVKRVITENTITDETPELAADSITGPETAIPELATIVQPFPSFGGAAAETKTQMNQRVSTRIKTKDRLVTTIDCFRMIAIQFPDVYYSKSVYDKKEKKNTNYIVKKITNASDSNAFIPLITQCEELEIQNFLAQRVSAFMKVSAENFNLNYIKIIADITIVKGNECSGVAKDVNAQLNIFLSPWIQTTQQQITIDKGVTTAQIASFLKTDQRISKINDIWLQIGVKDSRTGTIYYSTAVQEYLPADPSVLLVPSLDNTQIQYSL